MKQNKLIKSILIAGGIFVVIALSVLNISASSSDAGLASSSLKLNDLKISTQSASACSGEILRCLENESCTIACVTTATQSITLADGTVTWIQTETTHYKSGNKKECNWCLSWDSCSDSDNTACNATCS